MQFLQLGLQFLLPLGLAVLLVREVVLEFVLVVFQKLEVSFLERGFVVLVFEFSFELDGFTCLLVVVLLQLRDFLLNLDEEVLLQTAVTHGYLDLVQLCRFGEHQVV